MAKVRQMPELYLRGSLANITMSQLTADQKEHIEGLIAKVSTHPEMQHHKAKFMKKLSVTIAADYADDRQNAEQEFRVAIWRGVVSLFYHHKYTFICRACKSSTYTTKRSKPKAIDRIETPCPNCCCVEINDPGDCTILKNRIAEQNPYLTLEEFQASYADMPDGFVAPTYKTTIEAVPGAKKYDDPQAIMDDAKQLRKFFGEFIWNYFRQHINENKRKEHGKDLRPLLGPTDYLITMELISICNQLKIDYNYISKTEPENGRYTIRIIGLTTPPEFTAEFARIKNKSDFYGVPIIVTQNTIEVMVTPDALPIPIKESRNKDKTVTRWQIKIYQPEHVGVLDSVGTEDQDSSDFTLSQVSYRTVGGERMNYDDHIMSVENSEAMEAIRMALPDGHCKDVFDILSGLGEISDRFTAIYGDNTPKINHIAEFLGITARAVNTHKRDIEIHARANDFLPV